VGRYLIKKCKGRWYWRDMLRKLFLLVAVLIVSSSLVYGANSYTKAEVRNEAAIKIVDSKNALIAIPQNLVLNGNEIVAKIKNNMNQKVWITLKDKDEIKGITSSEVKFSPEFGLPIEPGTEITVTITLDIEIEKNKSLNSYPERLTFNARWDNGNALIKCFVNKN
jgi:hypothetical protein